MVLRSDGLVLQRPQQRAGSLVLQAGRQRWQLLPRPQAMWKLQQQLRSSTQPVFTGTWLGFNPSAPQRRWLLDHGAGSRIIGLKFPYVFGRVERWQSPVDRARLEIV